MKQSNNKFKRYLFKIANYRIVILRLKTKKQNINLSYFNLQFIPEKMALNEHKACEKEFQWPNFVTDI